MFTLTRSILTMKTEATHGMCLRSREDFVHKFSTWSHRRLFKFGKGCCSLQAFEVDHTNVVRQSKSDGTSCHYFTLLLWTWQVSVILIDKDEIGISRSLPRCQVIPYWLDCLGPELGRSFLQPQKFHKKMTEHILQDRRLRWFMTSPLPQFLIWHCVLVTEGQPICWESANLSHICSLCTKTQISCMSMQQLIACSPWNMASWASIFERYWRCRVRSPWVAPTVVPLEWLSCLSLCQEQEVGVTGALCGIILTLIATGHQTIWKTAWSLHFVLRIWPWLTLTATHSPPRKHEVGFWLDVMCYVGVGVYKFQFWNLR